MLELNKLYNMDCMEGMKLLDDNSMDSIVTDPPYELGFMGKKWDSTGIAYNVDLWRECLRVLKPGGHLLAFGGTRTYHRMTCAIEDAGFEIRDCIQWLYGSGFPKSHDISKAIDKKAGAEREIVGKYIRPDGSTRCNIEKHEGNIFQCGSNDKNITAPTTPEAKQWDGWGTCLKPANEPIVVARKPLSEKTIVDNVLKWGTGGINIDDCRISTNDKLGGGALTGSFSASEGWDRPWRHDEDVIKEKVQETKLKVAKAESLGRFPANVILDEEAGRMLDEQSGISKPRKGRTGKRGGTAWHGQKGIGSPDKIGRWPSDSGGGASRFFYCAKASKKERGEGNNHPTVKPVSLIKYLVTLVTPPDGVCLDPFIGSGTTAIACINTNHNYIGFEIDPDYYEAAQERMRIHMQQLTIFELL